MEYKRSDLEPKKVIDASRGHLTPPEPEHDSIVPISSQFGEWITNLGEQVPNVEIHEVNERHFQLDVKNREYGDYRLDAKDQDPWLTYGTQLTETVTGDNREEFYRSLLQENATLNGAKIGVRDDKVVLVNEEPKFGSSEASVIRDLVVFNEAFKDVFPKIRQRIRELDLDVAQTPSQELHNPDTSATNQINTGEQISLRDTDSSFQNRLRNSSREQTEPLNVQLTPYQLETIAGLVEQNHDVVDADLREKFQEFSISS